jgi:sodium/potassium/calcium exchanger 6
MGNGAPDVFATMASFGGAGDVLIGIGCLLGASMFINTIAVGAVLVASPCSVNPRDFVRDVAFQIVGVLSLGLVAALGRVNIFVAVRGTYQSHS